MALETGTAGVSVAQPHCGTGLMPSTMDDVLSDRLTAPLLDAPSENWSA